MGAEPSGRTFTGPTPLPGVIPAGEACRRRGGRGEVGECAGPVQDNPIASSLLQNKSDAKAIEKIFYCKKL